MDLEALNQIEGGDYFRETFNVQDLAAMKQFFSILDLEDRYNHYRTHKDAATGRAYSDTGKLIASSSSGRSARLIRPAPGVRRG